MTKVELIALAERWQTKADRAMERYQEDGLARHNREREQAQDLADALQIAASAADDHDERISLRGAVYCLAVKAHAAVDALDVPDRASDRDIWKLNHWDEYILGVNFEPPVNLRLEGQPDSLLIFHNSSDEEFAASMKEIVTQLEASVKKGLRPNTPIRL